MSELPLYQCHKQVRAVKIAAVEIKTPDGHAVIAPEDRDIGIIKTAAGWRSRFKGSEDDLGYFVQYEDGYESWSPTAVFENGYSLVNGD